MRYDVYCDESRPDLLSSTKPGAKFMLIGGLWLENSNRQAYKNSIHHLRDQYSVGGEFKWQKISPSRKDFYIALIDWFFELGLDLRFRCIAVDHGSVDLVHYHQSDQELGFYKFYYQMLHHWILDFNEYNIFNDFKSNRKNNRLKVLGHYLQLSNLSSTICRVQAVRSTDSVLIQLCDVLLGAAAARLNNTLNTGSAKEKVAQEIEMHIGHEIAHTLKSEQKYNVFKIDLNGGW